MWGTVKIKNYNLDTMCWVDIPLGALGPWTTRPFSSDSQLFGNPCLMSDEMILFPSLSIHRNPCPLNPQARRIIIVNFRSSIHELTCPKGQYLGQEDRYVRRRDWRSCLLPYQDAPTRAAFPLWAPPSDPLRNLLFVSTMSMSSDHFLIQIKFYPVIAYWPTHLSISLNSFNLSSSFSLLLMARPKQSSVKSVKKSSKKKSGTKALKEIKKYQKSSKLAIPKQPFKSLVQGMASQIMAERREAALATEALISSSKGKRQTRSSGKKQWFDTLNYSQTWFHTIQFNRNKNCRLQDLNYKMVTMMSQRRSANLINRHDFFLFPCPHLAPPALPSSVITRSNW